MRYRLPTADASAFSFDYPFGSSIGLRAAIGAGPSLGYRDLLTEAEEIAHEVVTVDLHCHPNRIGDPHFPELDPDVPDNMKAGRLDGGLFAVRGDYPVIRGDRSGRRYESRQPSTGELFQKTQDQLDRILDFTKGGKIGLSRSPAEILEAKKSAYRPPFWRSKGAILSRGIFPGVKFFYDKGVRVLQLMHYRVNQIGDNVGTT